MTVFNNNWGNIHDFTQDPDEQHFSNLPEVDYQYYYGKSVLIFYTFIIINR